MIYRNWAHDSTVKGFRFDRVNSKGAIDILLHVTHYALCITYDSLFIIHYILCIMYIFRPLLAHFYIKRYYRPRVDPRSDQVASVTDVSC